MSEHRFLRILKAYAENFPARAFAPHTHTSVRTIRDTITNLRHTLCQALRVQPNSFGGTGTILFNAGELSQLGRCVLSQVRCSRFYRNYRRCHAPRLAMKSDDCLLFEATTRIFCAVAPTPKNTCRTSVLPHEDHIANARAALRTEAHLEHHIGHVEDLWRALLEIDEFREVAGRGAMCHYPHHRFFEDLRRYLLANPLGNSAPHALNLK